MSEPTMHGSSYSAKAATLFESTLKALKDLGPSFSLNLFTNGFIFGNSNEIFHNVPENLYPYDLRMKSILTDIEYGRLPIEISHDDMPCKYVNGIVLCKVCDYRDDIKSRVFEEAPLKMGYETIIKDIYSNEKLTTDDKLKTESAVLLALYPHLNLDPTPTKDIYKEPIRMIDLKIDWEKNSRKMTGKSNKNITAGSEITESDGLEVERSEPVGSVVGDNWETSDNQEENVVDSHEVVKQ